MEILPKGKDNNSKIKEEIEDEKSLNKSTQEINFSDDSPAKCEIKEELILKENETKKIEENNLTMVGEILNVGAEEIVETSEKCEFSEMHNTEMDNSANEEIQFIIIAESEEEDTTINEIVEVNENAENESENEQTFFIGFNLDTENFVIDETSQSIENVNFDFLENDFCTNEIRDLYGSDINHLNVEYLTEIQSTAITANDQCEGLNMNYVATKDSIQENLLPRNSDELVVNESTVDSSVGLNNDKENKAKDKSVTNKNWVTEKYKKLLDHREQLKKRKASQTEPLMHKTNFQINPNIKQISHNFQVNKISSSNENLFLMTEFPRRFSAKNLQNDVDLTRMTVSPISNKIEEITENYHLERSNKPYTSTDTKAEIVKPTVIKVKNSDDEKLANNDQITNHPTSVKPASDLMKYVNNTILKKTHSLSPNIRRTDNFNHSMPNQHQYITGSSIKKNSHLLSMEKMNATIPEPNITKKVHFIDDTSVPAKGSEITLRSCRITKRRQTVYDIPLSQQTTITEEIKDEQPVKKNRRVRFMSVGSPTSTTDANESQKEKTKLENDDGTSDKIDRINIELNPIPINIIPQGFNQKEYIKWLEQYYIHIKNRMKDTELPDPSSTNCNIMQEAESTHSSCIPYVSVSNSQIIPEPVANFKVITPSAVKPLVPSKHKDFNLSKSIFEYSNDQPKPKRITNRRQTVTNLDGSPYHISRNTSPTIYQPISSTSSNDRFNNNTLPGLQRNNLNDRSINQIDRYDRYVNRNNQNEMTLTRQLPPSHLRMQHQPNPNIYYPYSDLDPPGMHRFPRVPNDPHHHHQYNYDPIDLYANRRPYSMSTATSSHSQYPYDRLSQQARLQYDHEHDQGMPSQSQQSTGPPPSQQSSAPSTSRIMPSRSDLPIYMPFDQRHRLLAPNFLPNSRSPQYIHPNMHLRYPVNIQPTSVYDKPFVSHQFYDPRDEQMYVHQRGPIAQPISAFQPFHQQHHYHPRPPLIFGDNECASSLFYM